MAKATGFTCDVPNCGTFATGTGEMPPHWMTLVISVEIPRESNFGAGTAGVEHKLSTMHVCSNKCLLKLAKERAGGVMARDRKNPDGNSPPNNYALGQLRKSHKIGKHDDDPRPGCPMCEEATASNDN